MVLHHTALIFVYSRKQCSKHASKILLYKDEKLFVCLFVCHIHISAVSALIRTEFARNKSIIQNHGVYLYKPTCATIRNSLTRVHKNHRYKPKQPLTVKGFCSAGSATDC